MSAICVDRAGRAARLARLAGCFLCFLAFSFAVQAEEAGDDVRTSVTDVEGISVHATEEEPRVLHIVPWQAPSVPARKREEIPPPEAGQILSPIEVETFRVHRHFRQTLDVLNVDRSGP